MDTKSYLDKIQHEIDMKSTITLSKACQNVLQKALDAINCRPKYPKYPNEENIVASPNNQFVLYNIKVGIL